MTTYPGRLDGQPVEIGVGAEGLDLGGVLVDWLDVDDVAYGPHSLTLTLADGSTRTVTHLGRGFDECCRELREARGLRRRPALTQAALAPLVAFESRTPDPAGGPPSTTDVLLFPHALTLEPRGGESLAVPLPLVAAVERDGWTIALRLRGLPDVSVRGLGARTDEFLLRLEEARQTLAAHTAAAYAEYDPALAGLGAPDGWALTAAEAPADLWPVLRTAWLAAGRAEQARALADLADDLRLGLWTEGGTARLPFLLAATGRGDAARVAVEAVDADDRATFCFATDDVDRLNAALVQTAFRREALSLPDDDLGRWAVAVRTQPAVRWARERLVARVVHDSGWADAVAAALRPGRASG